MRTNDINGPQRGLDDKYIRLAGKICIGIAAVIILALVAVIACSAVKLIAML